MSTESPVIDDQQLTARLMSSRVRLLQVSRESEGWLPAQEELKDAYAQLLSLHGGKLRATATRRAYDAGLPNPVTDGEDILQEAAVRGLVLLQRPSFEPHGQTWFAPWMAMIVINVTREAVRRTRSTYKKHRKAEASLSREAADAEHQRGPEVRFRRELESNQLARSETLDYLASRAKTVAQRNYLRVLRELTYGKAGDFLGAARRVDAEKAKALAASAKRWAVQELQRRAGAR